MNSPENNFEKSISSPLEKSIKKLKWFKNDFIDESPPEKLKPSDPNYHRYKCRGNFYQGVVAELANMVDDGFVSDPELLEMVNEFIRFATEEMDFSKFTTKEEIEKANSIIDAVLDSNS